MTTVSGTQKSSHKRHPCWPYLCLCCSFLPLWTLSPAGWPCCSILGDSVQCALRVLDSPSPLTLLSSLFTNHPQAPLHLRGLPFYSWRQDSHLPSLLDPKHLHSLYVTASSLFFNTCIVFCNSYIYYRSGFSNFFVSSSSFVTLPIKIFSSFGTSYIFITPWISSSPLFLFLYFLALAR